MSTDVATAQYLTFTLGDEVFAMDIRTVNEIIQPAAMTVVPLMPDFVRGVINLRGAVVPVLTSSHVLDAAPPRWAARPALWCLMPASGAKKPSWA
jgi:chemotaxis signal transduction protein